MKLRRIDHRENETAQIRVCSEIALRRVVVVVVQRDVTRRKCFNNVEDVGRAGRIGLFATFVKERS